MKMILAFVIYMVSLMSCAAGIFFLEGPARFACAAIFGLLGALGAVIYDRLSKLDIG